MMLKPSSSGWMRWSYLALIPVLAVFMYACNSPRNRKSSAEDASHQEIAPVAEQEIAAQEQESVPFQLVEKKPSFNGGDANEFSQWVNQHLKYPDEAKKDKLQGRVLVQFTIGADGVVRDVELLRSPSEILGAEAVRVISSSPRWEPGRQGDKAVPVTYTFPIIFQLK